MQPKIINADRKVSFPLSDDYMASLFGNIESVGIIQYHHLLVIYGPDQQPCLFLGAEWSLHDPSYRNEPVFGVFSVEAHESWEGSSDLVDDALFVLKAFSVAREILQIENEELAEGEAWAMAQVLKRFQDADNPLYAPHKDGYTQALRRNDARMVAYLQKSILA
jgi:hypothetical protein